MSTDDQRIGLADDLAARTDDDLRDLLSLRPDLASPPPQGTSVLAQRALAAASIALVGEELDLLTMAVIEQFIALSTGPGVARVPASVDADTLVKALSDRAEAAQITRRIDDLRRRAVFWGDADSLTAGAHLASALPWKALHLTGPLAHLTTDEVQKLIDGVDDRQRDLLTTLSRGPALGRSRDAGPGADPDSPVARLIALGLLARIDDQTVELPPMVAALIRGEPPLRTDTLAPPDLADEHASLRFGAKAVDAAAGGEALELIRHTTSLIDVLGRAPAAVLRSGALGVRELRRLAKVTGLDQKRVSFLVELLGHARLIDVGFPDPPPAGDRGEQAFAPTSSADTWLHSAPERQWATLLDAWLSMPRRAWQVGEPDRDGHAYPALSSELYDATAPVQRHLILDLLTELDGATPFSVDTVTASLAWRHPHRIRRLSPRVVGETLAEAQTLGVTAHQSLTSVGRVALSDIDPEAVDSQVLAAMRKALPEPVDHFLTQADLTLTVPGPMTPELSDQVELVADLESGGAASVYRVSEASVRRALDAGKTSSELLTMFTAHSSTPVPQSLTYLIEDVARKHGQLRVGIASSFIRCEDPTMLAAVLRSDAAEHLALRALAPTVAISPSEVRTVIDRLRDAGFAPAGEDSSGSLVDLRERGSRVSSGRGRRRPTPRRSTPTADQLQSVVSRMRSHDRATRATPATAGKSDAAPVRAVGGGESTTALIQLALRANRRLLVGYVDAHGSASRHVVTPRLLGAGQLVGTEEGSDDEQHFTLHRVTSVELLDN